jgi:hypothetical protein
MVDQLSVTHSHARSAMGDIVRLPKHSRASREQAERLRQLALELELSPEARGELDNALYRITGPPGRRWVFVMISPEQFRFISKAIQDCRNVATTFAVWNAVITYMRMDTGEIATSREQLAKDAGTLPSTAMGELTKIGAIIRHRRGRRTVYFVNPNVGWNGGEGSRREAARTAPELRLVDTGSGPAAD